jgi:DNA-binding NtrC family response regulator
MPPQRLFVALGKLFDAIQLPVYVLDEDLTIVFANQACWNWLGTAAEELLTSPQRCLYHSADADAEAVAAGLCPPPRVLAGETAVAAVSVRAADGNILQRRARFLPLGWTEGDVSAIVAIVDATDLPPSVAGPSGTGSLFGQQTFPADQSLAENTDPSPSATQAMQEGPSESDALHQRIFRFRREAAVRFGADRWIGQGPAMRLVRRQVEAAAVCASSVLLVGPPGSGRRHLATVIHHRRAETMSHSASAPIFVPLDCSLLGLDVQETVASAVAHWAARGPAAPSGTLFFHWVDELPFDVQPALADFLTRRASVWRLMAAAAEPLVELARRGQFHADLAALLCTLTIDLPALAQRREDLPLLAQLFLEECNAAGARQIGGFSPEALDRLDAYAWPGNLDELAQVVAQSHRAATSREIGPEDLPERLRLAVEAAAHPRRPEETIVLDEFLGRVERELIRRALARAKGNKARAARLLGMTRPRLYRRMVQLGLEEERD